MEKTKKIFIVLLFEAIQFFGIHWMSLLKLSVVCLIPFSLIHYLYWGNSLLISKRILEYNSSTLYIADPLIIFCEGLLAFFAFVVILNFIHQAQNRGQPHIWQNVKKAVLIFKEYLYVKLLYVVRVLLWFLLFLIPGFIFGVLYSFASFALIIDGKK